jgi:hypothetical protein
MKTEMEQHERLGTWEVVDLPPDREAIGCRWVYAVKTKPDGTFEKAKARLVAQGFTQVPGMDYFEITSPVAKFDSLRALIALATQFDWEIHTMDVKGAYLNCTLEEEIYMKQPPGFSDETEQVFRLKLTLYGLKQAGRRWHKRLKQELIDLGFTQSWADECVFIRIIEDRIEILIVYVDDLGIFTNSLPGLERTKNELKKLFEMTDLGPITKILGLKVDRDRENGTLKLSQGPYIDKILERFKMQDAHPVNTPIAPNTKLRAPEIPKIHPLYAQAIGSLMYAALGTRPDIAFAVQHLSQFTSQHNEEHWTAIK